MIWAGGDKSHMSLWCACRKYTKTSLKLGSSIEFHSTVVRSGLETPQMFYLSSLPIRSSNTLDRCFSLLSPLDTDSKSRSNFLFHVKKKKEDRAENKSSTQRKKEEAAAQKDSQALGVGRGIGASYRRQSN